MMMKRERIQKNDSCCPSVKPAQKSSIFAPRPFAPPVEEHDAPISESPDRARRFGHSLADISILPREMFQPKLVLGPVGDKYEQEADRVARQVVDTISSSDEGAVQRREDLEDEEELNLEEEEEELRRMTDVSASGGADVGPDLESAIHKARSGGQPLSDGVRQPMERAFGIDFGGVRVHADDQADRLNRSLQARAFTTGRDIFLRRGEDRLGSSEGRRLLAHELTHVVQQEYSHVKPTMQARGVSINDDATLEREADVMGLKSKLMLSSGSEGKLGRIYENVNAKSAIGVNSLIQAFWLKNKSGNITWEGDADNPPSEEDYQKTGEKRWKSWWKPRIFNVELDVWERISVKGKEPISGQSGGRRTRKSGRTKKPTSDQTVAETSSKSSEISPTITSSSLSGSETPKEKPIIRPPPSRENLVAWVKEAVRIVRRSKDDSDESYAQKLSRSVINRHNDYDFDEGSSGSLDKIIKIEFVLPSGQKSETAQESETGSSSSRSQLDAIERDSSGVREVINGIDVRLDIDQNKHQHPRVPIGTRAKGGGNRFNLSCNEVWHKNNTMRYMAIWAMQLKMTDGEKVYHGQARPVDDIHYEGFCYMIDNRKYVLFHCYPADGSNLKLQLKKE